jgi:maltose alpha-D-glucosyltransferase/alpha-amylase
MAFHFPLMPRMFMAVRQEDRHPIVEILRQTPDIPENCQWAMFLRNHDELTLEMVTDEERDYMYQAYAADPQMRINVGIRRRLAPLLENSRRRIELLHSLLFSMPGTPIVYYGDELGMGDNIYLGDRNGVRTPMQWTGDRNGGFSRTDPARLYAPPVMDPVYGYQAINVEAQERAPFSLLNWMKRVIGLRKQSQVFGRGTIEFLPANNRKILAYLRKYHDEEILCVANLSRSVQPVELDLSRFKGLTPVEMLFLTEFPSIGELPYFLTLGGYAFYVFRLQQSPASLTARVAPETVASVGDTPALFMGVAWDTLLDGNVRTLIERDLLVGFLQRQRWFGGKARGVRTARFVDWGLLRRGFHPLFLTIVEVEYQDGERDDYFLPLAIGGLADVKTIEERSPHGVLARVTGARKGVLFDAWLDNSFARAMLESIEQSQETRMRRGTVQSIQTSLFKLVRGEEALEIRRLGGEQSNTSLVYGDRLILKLFRRLQAGVNPDYEIGRQLTERIGYQRVPAVTGAFEHHMTAEQPMTIGLLQQFVESQADGWHHATDEVGRYYEDVEGTSVPAMPTPAALSELLAVTLPAGVRDAMGAYLSTAETLGRRTGEVHMALASDSSAAAFAPEQFTQDDLANLTKEATGQAQTAVDTLRVALDGGTGRDLPPDVATQARALLAAGEDLLGRIRATPALQFSASKIRVHGDYHLGQVLWAEGDFYILDFEGEPARPIAQRRQKQSPLKDVAGMLRSFSYAAYAGLFAHVSTRSATIAEMEPWARIWQTSASVSFLKGYFGTVDGALFIPAESSQRDLLLQLFMLDKALYELNYELNNRPDWVRIPLTAILGIVRGE